MDKRTLKALKGSIRKWARIAAGTGVDNGTRDCPLCALFFQQSCEECPVRENTGRWHCRDTPYERWGDLFINGRSLTEIWRATSEKKRAAARAELKFLRSLLPKKRKAA